MLENGCKQETSIIFLEAFHIFLTRKLEALWLLGSPDPILFWIGQQYADLSPNSLGRPKILAVLWPVRITISEAIVLWHQADQLHNLRGQVQNEHEEPLAQNKDFKMATTEHYARAGLAEHGDPGPLLRSHTKEDILAPASFLLLTKSVHLPSVDKWVCSWLWKWDAETKAFKQGQVTIKLT